MALMTLGDVLAAQRHLDLRMIFDRAAHVGERPAFDDGERLEHHAALRRADAGSPAGLACAGIS